MNDLISREEALETLRYLTDFVCDKEYEDGKVLLFQDSALERIAELEPAQRWIPVTERLPDDVKREYWICTDTGYQCECRWTNNRFGIGELDEWGWSIFDIPQYQKVVAWMPLPEPYKERE